MAGAVSITAGISLLVYALVDAVDVGWGDQQTIGLIAIALALIAAFVAIELRSSHPLIPFAIFRRRTLTGANIVAVLVAMSLFSMFFFVSLYMQQVLGFDALKAGVAYLPLAIGIIISAGVASQLVTKVGFKPVHGGRVRCSSPAGSRGSRRCRRTAPTSATCCSRRCWPPSGSGSCSCR